MGNMTLKMLARELNLSTAAVSKALRDSHEISAATKERVLALANELNYSPNPYASSLRRRKSKTIAVVLPEVADSFFSLAINGIEEVAEAKGYHVLIYLTHESLAREQAIFKTFQNGRVDGVLMSVSTETTTFAHIETLHSKDTPVVFFDRACDEINTAQVITDDYESGYNATLHLIEQGCRSICFLSISNSLPIINKRQLGCETAVSDHAECSFSSLLLSGNDDVADRQLIHKKLGSKKHPDGIIISVEKLTTPLYMVCKALKLRIPADVKVVGFSNLTTVNILNPSLTTITQPAFEMGKAAAMILFKALDKKNFIPKKEHHVIPSQLNVRESTG